MASSILYPPSIDSYLPSFPVHAITAGGTNDNSCAIQFSLSKFNGVSDIKAVHIAVTKQSNGLNVVKMEDDTSGDIKRYRSTGIIILEGTNLITTLGDNLYSVILKADDLYPTADYDNGATHFEGLLPGWIYKIQIRLSSVKYSEEIDPKPPLSMWLKNNASNFSEWSTVCAVKPFGDVNFNFTTLNTVIPLAGGTVSKSYSSSTLDLSGNMESIYDSSETLASYCFQLTQGGNTLEDSGIITNENNQNINDFRYTFKTELTNNSSYTINFSFATNNGYEGTKTIVLSVSYTPVANYPIIYVATIENHTTSENPLYGISTVSLEEDEGRIGLKFVNETSNSFTGKIAIRRSSSKENFTRWEDIKILDFNNTNLNNLNIFYDYTVESGVWYLYGVQQIVNNQRTPLIFPTENNVEKKNPSLRNFEYSFLLGENNQQLKLKYDNTMGSYKIQQMENKVEPIGGYYPIISRNAALRYRILPINGLISFNMDECNLFCGKQVIYKYEDVLALYQDYEKNRGTAQYNYIYERDFRKEVMNFLVNGKPKLFKSPTEGNIVLRLTDVNFTPNQSLSRLVYSFTSNGNEIADDNLDSYIKYHLLDKSSIQEHGITPSAGHIHNSADSNNSPVKEV